MLSGPGTARPCCPAAAAASCTCPNPSTDSFFERIWCLLFNAKAWQLQPAALSCRQPKQPRAASHARSGRPGLAHRKGAQRSESSSFTTSGWSAGTDPKECLNFFLLTMSGNLSCQLLSTSNSAGLQALLLSFPSTQRRVTCTIEPARHKRI